MEKRFYTTGEVAKITGISQKTIKNYCSQGKIISETTPITNYRRIPKEDLVRFLESNSIPLEKLNQTVEKKILVTDDDPQIVRLISQYLAAINPSFIIETAGNGYEACIKAGIFIPDLLVLDLNMPKVDGFEVLRNIKTVPETRNAEVIICTGFATEENIDALRPFDVASVIQKPVSFETFKEAVDTVFAGKRA